MTIMTLLAATVLLTALVLACAWQFRRKRANVLDLANIAEGTHPTGHLRKLTDAAITTRHLIYKEGSDDNHVAVMAATANQPLGVVDDEAAAAEAEVALKVFGQFQGTVLLVADEAIDADDEVYASASGKITPEPTTAGTYWKVGTALADAAADGDLVEVAHHAPIKVVVIAALTAPATANGADAGTTQTLANACKADLVAIDNALATPALLKILA